jgi:cytochrome c oxidase cbb3-type subunit 3
MSDFTISSLGWIISLVVIISIVACFLLAWSLASRKAPMTSDGEVDSTGHVWDGDLRELNNPLPRWWLYLFYITCVFGALYLVLYPGLGTYKGVFGWSSTGQYEQEVADAKSEYEPLYTAYLEQNINDVASNPEAVAMGERLYLTYCTQCHGSDARGSRSFPNLSDNDWLGAGTPDYIKTTVLNGRNAIMPAMYAAIGNTDDSAEAVAHYVLSLSDSNHNAEKAALGQAKFAVCSACHGPTGAGNPLIGAPNLTDDTWLYGGSLTSVQSAIKNGFNNQMPAFGELLGEGKAHVVAAYIWSLSNDGVSN